MFDNGKYSVNVFAIKNTAGFIQCFAFLKGFIGT